MGKVTNQISCKPVTQVFHSFTRYTIEVWNDQAGKKIY